MRTAIIGGGAAGFFLAINLKEMASQMQVDIFERGKHVLSKVRISGGGRCNCTNSFANVADLSRVYPRGHRLLKRLFNEFDHRDAFSWFERHGVRLTTQDDQCVFPASQNSQTIIDSFLSEARRHGIAVHTEQAVASLEQLSDYDFLAVTTGGQPHAHGLQWLADAGHQIEAPVPSLFTFSINHPPLHQLMGTVATSASVQIPGTKMRAEGPLLVTHWGVSGPAILKLSSYAARLLAERAYHAPLSINWTSSREADLQDCLATAIARHQSKQVSTVNPFGLPARLWNYLLERSLPHRPELRWGEVSKKDLNRLVNVLSNDTYEIAGRAAFKDEFVTCGGVSLSSVFPNTLESRCRPRLYFAGEVLDIDGITGGFNFQAAWTTAYVAAKAISRC